MTYLYWAVIGIIVVAILFGIKDFLYLFISSWYENGVKFTILLIIFIALLISPAFIKEYAPGYYGWSIWALILYSLSLLGYRQLNKGTHKED